MVPIQPSCDTERPKSASGVGTFESFQFQIDVSVYIERTSPRAQLSFHRIGAHGVSAESDVHMEGATNSSTPHQYGKRRKIPSRTSGDGGSAASGTLCLHNFVRCCFPVACLSCLTCTKSFHRPYLPQVAREDIEGGCGVRVGQLAAVPTEPSPSSPPRPPAEPPLS